MAASFSVATDLDQPFPIEVSVVGCSFIHLRKRTIFGLRSLDDLAALCSALLTFRTGRSSQCYTVTIEDGELVRDKAVEELEERGFMFVRIGGRSRGPFDHYQSDD